VPAARNALLIHLVPAGVVFRLPLIGTAPSLAPVRPTAPPGARPLLSSTPCAREWHARGAAGPRGLAAAGTWKRCCAASHPQSAASASARNRCPSGSASSAATP